MSIANLPDLNLPSINGGLGIGCPAGVVVPYAGNNPVAGWLDCDGSTYQVGDYLGLYQTIGSIYGGETKYGGNGNFSDTNVFQVDNIVGATPDIQVGDVFICVNQGIHFTITAFLFGTGGVGSYEVSITGTEYVGLDIDFVNATFNVPNLNTGDYRYIAGSTTSINDNTINSGDGGAGLIAPANMPLLNVGNFAGTIISAQSTNQGFIKNSPHAVVVNLYTAVPVPEGNFVKADSGGSNGVNFSFAGANVNLGGDLPNAPINVAIPVVNSILMRYIIRT
jgi:hypothetical protein